MKNNKQYNRSKKVRLSMLMAMLVLGSLFTTTLRASTSALSHQTEDEAICCYFEEVPAHDVFKLWRKEVVRLANKYKPKKQYKLKEWLKDLETLEKILKYPDKDCKSFAALIEKYQAAKPSLFSPLLCGPAPPAKEYELVHIGDLSRAKSVNKNPVIALVDELNRESHRAHEVLELDTCGTLMTLCFEICKEELGEAHKMTKLVAPSPPITEVISNVASSLLSMFTGSAAQPDKGNKND